MHVYQAESVPLSSVGARHESRRCRVLRWADGVAQRTNFSRACRRGEEQHRNPQHLAVGRIASVSSRRGESMGCENCAPQIEMLNGNRRFLRTGACRRRWRPARSNLDDVGARRRKGAGSRWRSLQPRNVRQCADEHGRPARKPA